MTFDDQITADHYRELVRLSNPLNSKFALWANFAMLGGIGLAIIGAMGAFFYTAAKTLMDAGLAGLIAHPSKLLLIGAGLVLCLAAVVVLIYRRKMLQIIWKMNDKPDISELDLREGLNLGPARFTLSDKSVRVEMPLDSDEISWSAFSHFREAANGIMLMFNRTNGMVVPSGHLIAVGEYEAALSLVSTHVKEAD